MASPYRRCTKHLCTKVASPCPLFDRVRPLYDNAQRIATGGIVESWHTFFYVAPVCRHPNAVNTVPETVGQWAKLQYPFMQLTLEQVAADRRPPSRSYQTGIGSLAENATLRLSFGK